MRALLCAALQMLRMLSRQWRRKTHSAGEEMGACGAVTSEHWPLLASPRILHASFWPSGDNPKRSMLLFDCPGTIHPETISFFNMSVLHIPVALPHARSCVLAGGRSTCSRECGPTRGTGTARRRYLRPRPSRRHCRRGPAGARQKAGRGSSNLTADCSSTDPLVHLRIRATLVSVRARGRDIKTALCILRMRTAHAYYDAGITTTHASRTRPPSPPIGPSGYKLPRTLKMIKNAVHKASCTLLGMRQAGQPERLRRLVACCIVRHTHLGRVLVDRGKDANGALITYKEDFLDDATATRLFRFCDSQVRWARETDDFGPQERLSCFVGDQGCSFAYVGLFLRPNPWPEPIKHVRERLNALLR